MSNPESWAALVAALSALLLAILDRRRDAVRATMEARTREEDRERSDLAEMAKQRDENMRLLYEERTKNARLEAELAFLRGLDTRKSRG